MYNINRKNKVEVLKNNATFNPFSGPELEKVIPTTKTQAEIWTGCYFGGDDAASAYNESLSVEFNGPLDTGVMDLAIQKLIERHEALRATFSTNGIYMSIYKQLSINIAQLNLSHLDPSSQNTILQEYLHKDAHFLFDLINGPLIKVGLLKFSETNHRLILTVHHIICDGWSLGIILQDLGALYSAYVEGKIPNLPEPIPFSAYADEEQLFLQSEKNKKGEQFWNEIYKKSVPIINLPTDNPRPPLRTYKSQRLDFALDTNLLSKLKQTGLNAGSSLVTTLLVSFELFLYQITGQDDIVVGLPSAGQATTGMNHLVGHCVNLLPLRSRPDLNKSFNDYLKQRKSELFDCYDYSQLSFGQLLQTINIARDPSRIPLVPITFNIDIGMTDGVHFTNLTYKLTSNPRAFETFEIFLNASGTEKNLVFEWSFNTALFLPETIKKMMASLEKIIEKVTDDPTKTLEQITNQDFISEYNEINATNASYPNSVLHDLIDLQAKQTPENVALEFLDTVILYKDLQVQINQMAHYLQDKGILPGDFIAVSMPRCSELVISLLAITQCGAAYLPLDPEYPISRLQFMMDDSEAKFLLTNKDVSQSLLELADIILIEDAMAILSQFPVTKLERKVDFETVAYLLYTSGSTGKPKGVPITHKNLVNFLFSMAKEPGINPNDRLLSITTISFDIAGLELYLPLIKGATLIVADNETAKDGRLLLDVLKKQKISFLQATPTTWSMLLDSGWSAPLPIKALCGGEAMSADLAKELINKCDTIWNVYGPTETTIWSSVKQITSDDSLITIGKPIANTQLYIINEHGKLLPPGKIGEIAIGGDGLAAGYWKRPELTDEKFIINEFSNSKISVVYRTGDLGKLLPNNEIVCLGRLDQQVKIRGHRIEPGEVEQALMELEGIKYAVVLADKNFLIGHIVPEGSIENAVQQIPLWREKLSSQLPSHLVPHDFNLLEKFPTTLNGKIDRKSLLEYKTDTNIGYTQPRTEEEEIVAAIWKESLNLENVDIFSNFFEMGGHSLVAVRVMSKIEEKTGKKLPLSTLFEHSTIEKFAKLIAGKEIYSDCLVAIKSSGTKIPLFIVHGAGLNVLNFVNLSKYFDDDQPVYGIQGTAKEYNDWYESIEDMAAHYVDAIIKKNPNGPYALAGYSFGGIIAFEMTRQLNELGKEVSLTALLDSSIDSSFYYRTYWQKKIVRYKEMIFSWRAFKIRINENKYILKSFFGKNNNTMEQKVMTIEQLIEADGMIKKIIDRYQLKPQHFKVDLFRSKDDIDHKVDPNNLGWKKAALKGVAIHNISGNHYDILAPPNDKELARLLQEILDKKHEKI
ncbi:non-ribosomal peptide synthetase [Flavobacterium sp. 245]|uniref:non-ribosomal peptide synthetase n=1 Tax=Flavobacterium sp. 245 TaxID=2512115 RepID=UPI00105BCD90|nr:non-ribosomal peptide synthetase [Flavobacterium sp. 245]TDO97045.1 amino acid adenylation domain-containing protein [Flavobacterium sp. 245]